MEIYHTSQDHPIDLIIPCLTTWLALLLAYFGTLIGDLVIWDEQWGPSSILRYVYVYWVCGLLTVLGVGYIVYGVLYVLPPAA